MRPFWWQSRGLLACLLFLFSLVFAGLGILRRLAYRSGLLRTYSCSVPIVIVGNLAVGGSGKTPVVVALARSLREYGYVPGIVSRGYGGTLEGPELVSEMSQPHEVGDEPVLLARLTHAPICIARDRVKAVQHLLQAHPKVDVILSDDGLQHYRMQRVVEIIVIDEAVMGNRWLLPAGPLREPLRRARRADLVIANGPLNKSLRTCLGKVPLVPMQLIPGELYQFDWPHRTTAPHMLADLKLRAVAGIGRPERFFDTLRALGLPLYRTDSFPDHHFFELKDLELQDCDALLMTEKDAIKCASIAPPQTWILPVRAHINADALAIILEKLRGSEIT